MALPINPLKRLAVAEGTLSHGEEGALEKVAFFHGPGTFVCHSMKPVGEPDAGNLHVRFDERGVETESLVWDHRATSRLYRVKQDSP